MPPSLAACSWAWACWCCFATAAAWVVLALQERCGWRAGYVQMTLDCLVLLSAFFIVNLERALWSVVAALTLNQVLSMNHRPGRYGG